MGEGYVDTNGVRLWYEDLGDPAGDPIVLVMGATASAISWPPELLEPLVAAGHRVVRFDNRDIGLSTHIDFAAAPYSLDDMVTDTVELMDALGIDRAHLVGASMGGMISQMVALQHPGRVRSLALIITTAGPDERLSPPSDEVLVAAGMPATTDAELEEREVAMWRLLTGSAFPFDESARRAHARADLARGTNPQSAHPIVAFSTPSRLEALAAVTVPTVVVQGGEDPIFPPDHGEALAKAIPGAKLVTWGGVGHEVPDQHGEELVALILANAASA
jgi:pimeloyl-ACP methyl ester carboxylesterase